MSIGDANLLSREDVGELQRMVGELRRSFDNADPTMTIRVGAMDVAMLLKEVVHLRRRVDELLASGTKHVLERQIGFARLPGNWQYDHQMTGRPDPSIFTAVRELLEFTQQGGVPGPDLVGYGLRVWHDFRGEWVANAIWKAK